MVKSLGERQSRDTEQYLIGILNALRPRQRGQQRGVQHMLDRGKRITHFTKDLFQLIAVLCSCTRTRERAGRRKPRLRPPGRPLKRGRPGETGRLRGGSRTEDQGAGPKGGHPQELGADDPALQGTSTQNPLVETTGALLR